MKIGFDAKRIYHNSTGLGNYGRDVIRMLIDHQASADLVLLNPKPTSRILNFDTKAVTEINPRGIWRFLRGLWRIWGLKSQLKSEHLDIFHGLSGEIPHFSKSNQTKWLVTIHDLIFLTHPQFYNPIDVLIYKWKQGYACRKANHIIAISHQTKRDIIRFFKINPNKITVVYQGCHEAFKRSFLPSELTQLREQLQLPSEFILNVGTIQERKNAIALLKAIKDTPYCAVFVGGEKKYAKKVHAYVRKNQMQEQVYFIKGLDMLSLAKLYRCATIFCYTSIYEGFGIPIIEALFSGLPVVCHHEGVFSEAAGPDAIYLDVNDETKLKAELSQLMQNPNKRAIMSERGLNFAQRFKDEQVVCELIKVYKKLM